MEPLRLALAIDDPRREAALLSLVQDVSFRVDGRQCLVSELCASVRDAWAAAAGEGVDAMVVASTLNAIPFATLRDLASVGRRIVVLAPDPLAERWDQFPAQVVSTEPDAIALMDALHEAMRGTAGESAAPRSDAKPTVAGGGAPASEVIAVTSGYAAEGRTTVATGLAFALGVVAGTTLVDADTRGGAVEFGLGVDPGRNMCLLAQQEPDTPADWDTSLSTELQPMGAPSRYGVVLAGVTKPSLRPWVTPYFFEHLISALRERYRYIVLDTSGGGWSPDDGAIDKLCLRLADRVLMVVRPDVQGVMVAQRVLRQRAHLHRVSVLLNQAGLADQYSRSEIEAVLRVPVSAILPADPRGVAAARARHRPVVCQPGCRVAPPLLDLARRLCRGKPLALAADVVDPIQPWWRRLAVGATGALR
jgi:MinD-like ATPase involved in chromosome partitioning or flagellar assembly